ncbi:MAG TPA: hypothetical protein VLZ03_02180 [Thermodesulfobacteriota bacterium]|nr:hypothetical protein [Thermodesulfobacteriota bacterium]
MTDVGRFGFGDLGDVESLRPERHQSTYITFRPTLIGAGTGNGDVVTGDTIRTWPFFIPMTKTFDLFVWLQLALGPATKMRFGIYGNKMGDIYPDKLLWASAEWDLATLGVYYKEEAINPVLKLNGPKLYWFASHKGGNNASYGTMTGIPPHLPTYRVFTSYGPLPNTFPPEDQAYPGADYPAAAWFHQWG